LVEGKNRGLDVSGLVVRHARKKSGLGNILEGIPNGKKVILMDDLVNSGDTLFQALEVLEGHQIEVSKIFLLASFENKNFAKSSREKPSLPPVSYLFSPTDLGLKNIKKEGPELLRLMPVKKRILTMSDPNRVLVVPKSSPLIDEKNIYVG